MKKTLTLFFLFLPHLLFARPLRKEDVHVKTYSERKLYLKKDYTYTVESLVCRELLDESESAKSLGTQSHTVDLGLSKIKNIEAWSEWKGKKTPVSEIHSGLAAAQLSGFSDIKRYTFSFPHAVQGAKLCYKTKEDFVPSIEGYFEDFHIVSTNFLEKGSFYKIQSEIPLHILNYNLKASWNYEKHKTSAGLYVYSWKSMEDTLNGYIFENESDKDISFLPQFIAKSHTNYSEKPFLNFKDRIYTQIDKGPLSKEALDFIKSIKTMNLSKKEKIQKTMAWIQDQIRYSGDWRTTEGKLIPRSFEDIWKTRYGDCKDYSLITIKILKAIGIEAKYAIIYRGAKARLSFDHEQSFFLANHAVVFVEDEKESFVVDPTNTLSTNLNLADILDRGALVFADPILIKKTKSWRESPSLLHNSCHLEFHKNHENYRCHLKISGISAVNFHHNFFRDDEDLNKRWFMEEYFGGYKRYSFKSFPNFDSREAQPFFLDFEVDMPPSLESPLGKVITLKQPFLSIMNIKQEKRLTGIEVPMIRRRSEIRYKNVKIAHPTEKLNCKVDSPWFLIDTKIKEEEKDVIYSVYIESLKDRISPEEFLSKDFEKVRKIYNNCIRSKAMILVL